MPKHLRSRFKFRFDESFYQTGLHELQKMHCPAKRAGSSDRPFLPFLPEQRTLIQNITPVRTNHDRSNQSKIIAKSSRRGPLVIA